MKACLALRSVETVFRGVTPLRGAEPEACCRVSALGEGDEAKIIYGPPHACECRGGR